METYQRVRETYQKGKHFLPHFWQSFFSRNTFDRTTMFQVSLELGKVVNGTGLDISDNTEMTVQLLLRIMLSTGQVSSSHDNLNDQSDAPAGELSVPDSFLLTKYFLRSRSFAFCLLQLCCLSTPVVRSALRYQCRVFSMCLYLAKSSLTLIRSLRC